MRTTRVIVGLLFLGVACGTAHGQELVVVDQFDAGLGSLVGCGFDASASRVWVYGDFDATLASYTPAGTADASITRPGEGSNDVDIDFATTGFTLGTTFVPAGTLLFIDGETGPAEVYGVDPSTGTVLSTLVTAFGNNHVVGGAWHPGRGTLFLVADQNDSQPNTIAEIDPATGAVLNSFGVGTGFTVNFGDLDVSTASSDLVVVSDVESTMRVLTPTGTFVVDLPLPVGVSSPSGLAIDDASSEGYICSTAGVVYRVGPAPTTTTSTTSTSTTEPESTTTTSSTSTSSTSPASTSTITSTTSTTTPPATTTSTTAPAAATTTTSTSTTVAASTTTTTLPAGGCDAVTDGPTFASILCRVTALRDRANGEAGLGAFQPKLLVILDKAVARTTEAQALCGESNLKKAKKRLQQATKALSQYAHRLAGRPARKQLEDTLRLQYLQDGEVIIPDAKMLRSQVACPADAASG